jgi:WD40 repeat protein
VHWSPDDTRLVTAGMDGAVYEWRLRDLKREKENVLKGCAYTCVLATPDSRAIYAVGSDRKLKELEESPVRTASTAYLLYSSPLKQVALAINDMHFSML